MTEHQRALTQIFSPISEGSAGASTSVSGDLMAVSTLISVSQVTSLLQPLSIRKAPFHQLLHFPFSPHPTESYVISPISEGQSCASNLPPEGCADVSFPALEGLVETYLVSPMSLTWLQASSCKANSTSLVTAPLAPSSGPWQEMTDSFPLI
ncbi:hypothetical protein ILYODFUR_028937 [Ilyodon furcidens]|uniref:Uncharacterized protein n=1 Tax=Ilyodon furcidens TaxID=33524 RepID=A0ABV0UMZ6_9TELE